VTSMRNAARAIHRVCSRTFPNGIVLLEKLQAVKDLETFATLLKTRGVCETVNDAYFG
jgi:hypothetical protein